MMKKSILHCKKLTFVIGLFFCTNALAQEDVTSLIEYLQKVVNTTAESVANYIYEFNRLLPKTIATNVAEPQVQKSTQDYTKGLAFCQIYNILPRHKKAQPIPIPDTFKSLNPRNQYKNLDDFCQKIVAQPVDRNDANKFKQKLSQLAATDTETPKKLQPFTFAINQQTGSLVGGNNSFNFEDLFAPKLYGSQAQKEDALNFVNFIGKLYEPSPLDLNTWNQAVEDEADKPSFINYQMALRSYITNQSVALSNLYNLIAERTEQPEIASLQLKNNKGEDIKSPLQYRHYLATRRTTDQDWYDTMNSASSSTVSRETLFTLAEIQRTLYHMEETNKRILATLSGLLISSTATTGRQELQMLAKPVVSTVTGQQIKPTPPIETP